MTFIRTSLWNLFVPFSFRFYCQNHTHSPCINRNIIIITARSSSCKGNVFTSMYHSFCPQGHAWQRCVAKGGHVWLIGHACQRWGIYGGHTRGCAWQGGLMCAGETVTEAGSMHPTWKHSCCVCFWSTFTNLSS